MQTFGTSKAEKLLGLKIESNKSFPKPRVYSYGSNMLDTIEDVYQEQTAQTFQIMANASTTLPLLALHFIDHEKNVPDYALHREIGSVLHSEFVAMVDIKRRQLNARCRDLVEVTEDKDEPFFFRYGGLLSSSNSDGLPEDDGNGNAYDFSFRRRLQS
jgi:hypothetical protein